MATRTRTLSALQVDTRGLEEKLQRLDKRELPFAKSLAINLLAKDTIRIEKIEMQSVFDRPKPFIVGGVRMLKKAKKKESPQFAVIGFTDIKNKAGNRPESVVKTHIEGGERGSKGIEYVLRRFNIMSNNEFLVTARHAPRDSYGNLDIDVLQKAIAFFARPDAETRKRIAKARQTRGELGIFQLLHDKTKFFVARTNRPSRTRWGKASTTSKKSTRRMRLVWLIARRAPRYRKRFDFYGEAETHAGKFAGYFGRQALDRTLATSRR